MAFLLMAAEMAEAIHDSILNPGEMAGRARDKSLESALMRVDNRLAYGLIGDLFDLAAAYATAIARGHCFNDGNMRTAFHVMDAVLTFNGKPTRWNTEDVGQIIMRVAQGLLDEGGLADWLRGRD